MCHVTGDCFQEYYVPLQIIPYLLRTGEEVRCTAHVPSDLIQSYPLFIPDKCRVSIESHL